MVFDDALRRLAGAATYLYKGGSRYWYSTQPTVTKLAEDRAEQLKRDLDKVARELDRRLREDLRRTGEFCRVHPMPRSGQEVPDELDVGLVVLGTDYPYSREPDSAAEAAAKAEAPKAEVASAGLPAGYESLTVAQITAGVKSWSHDQVEAALAYERVHAARKGALSALESALAKGEKS